MAALRWKGSNWDFIGFDVQVLTVKRQGGKVYVWNLEYKKLSAYRRHLVDAVLKYHRIEDLEKRAVRFGRQPGRFQYPRVLIVTPAKKTLGIPAVCLAPRAAAPLLPAYTVWWKGQQEIAQARKEAQQAQAESRQADALRGRMLRATEQVEMDLKMEAQGWKRDPSMPGTYTYDGK